MVLRGGFSKAAAEFRGREGFGLGAFGADGVEEARVGPVECFEGVEMCFGGVAGDD